MVYDGLTATRGNVRFFSSDNSWKLKDDGVHSKALYQNHSASVQFIVKDDFIESDPLPTGFTCLYSNNTPPAEPQIFRDVTARIDAADVRLVCTGAAVTASFHNCDIDASADSFCSGFFVTANNSTLRVYGGRLRCAGPAQNSWDARNHCFPEENCSVSFFNVDSSQSFDGSVVNLNGATLD